MAGVRHGDIYAAGVKCTFCSMEIREGLLRQTCGYCGDPYHEECFRKAGGECVKEECRRMLRIAAGHGRGGGGGGGRVLASARLSLLDELKPLLLKLVGAAVLLVACYALYQYFAHDAEYYYRHGKELARKLNAGSDDRRVWRVTDLHRGFLAAEGGAQAANIEKTVNLENQIADYQMAIKKKPGYTEAWFDMGLAYMELGKDQEAFKAFEKTLELKPDYAECMLVIGASCTRLGDIPGAEKWYKKALERDAELLSAHESLAFLYDKKMDGKKELAAAEYRLVLAKRPDDGAVASSLAEILIGQKKFEEAMTLLASTEKLDPTSVPVRSKLALLHFVQGNWEKSLGYAEPVAREDSTAWDTRKIQAICLHRLGRNQEAYVVVKEVVATLQDAEALSLAGRLAVLYGEPNEGIGYLRRAFDVGRTPQLLEQIGDALLYLDRPEEAKSAFEQLRSLNSAYPRVNFKVGFAAASMKDRVKSLAAVRELLQRTPKDPDLRALEARLLREDGDAATALAQLKAIVAENPKTPFPYIQLGILLRSAGNRAGALAALRQALAFEEDPQALFELGNTYAEFNNEAAAREFFSRYIDKVSFGRDYEKARTYLDKGGVAVAPDEFATLVDPCRDSIRKLATGAFANPEHREWVSAAFHATASAIGILAADMQRAQTGVYALQNSLGILAQAPAANAQFDADTLLMVQEADLTRNVEMWLADLSGAATSLADFVRKRDAELKYRESVERIVEEVRSQVGSAPTPEARACAAARAFTSALTLFTLSLAENPTVAKQLERIDGERRMQSEFAGNALQGTCGEVYAAVKVADILVGVRDRRNLYQEQRIGILRRFDQRESRARNVMEQLRNGGIALSELLALLVADRSMRP